MALAQNIPLVAVNHLQGHVLAHFVKDDVNQAHPSFPFLCLLVSGGHTQLIVVRDYLDMEIVGETIDDAAGEAFDKCAKVVGLPYPGGPVIDKLSRMGDASAFQFAKPSIKELDFSFSGLKTSFLYTLRDRMNENPNFIEERKADLCASLQHTIISILLSKVEMAANKYGITEVAIAGGVSANSGLRDGLTMLGLKKGWNVYLPQFRYTTDNAAMIAITGYYRFLAGDLSPHSVTPLARFPINH